jgi:integrase
MKLNKMAVSELALPSGKAETVVFDDAIPGFGVRLRAGGSKNWIFQYRQGEKQRRLSFGSLNALGLAEAREKAARLHAQVKLGHDPAGQKLEARGRAAETFRPAVQLFLARQKTRLKPRTYTEVERHLLNHSKPLHELHLSKIDRRTIASRLGEIAGARGPAAANRVRASLSACFAWAMREGLVDSNPVVATNKAIESGARTRVLTDGELRRIWNALEGDHYGAIVKLLALTGQRREEIGSLRWSEVDLDRALITLPAERVKNKREHQIPLSAPALAILEAQPHRTQPDGTARDLIFGDGKSGYSGWSRSKEALDQRIAKTLGTSPEPWRLHDLRRTMSTMMHDRLGIAPHIVEAVLNHVDGHRRGVAGVYNRASYSAEKAGALATWAEQFMAVVRQPARPEVVPPSL